MATNVTALQRLKYGDKHEQDSDEELRRFAEQTTLKIQAMSVEEINHNSVFVEELLAEATVCYEILKTRGEMREQAKKAHTAWNASLRDRRFAAVRTLRKAVTPNGQLVAAILEDEGDLSEREIASWCDELAALDQSDLDALLSALVEEGVLTFRNRKYAVRQVCTESLFPENPTEWALQQIGDAEISDEEKVVLKLMEKKGTAICPEDFPAIVNDTSFLSAVRAVGCSGGILQEKVKELRASLKRSDMYESVLNRLKDHSVLTETVINGIHLFYFPMLGERRAD